MLYVRVFDAEKGVSLCSLNNLGGHGMRSICLLRQSDPIFGSVLPRLRKRSMTKLGASFAAVGRALGKRKPANAEEALAGS